MKAEEEIRSAATVILVRDVKSGIEVLLLRRNPELKFMGGGWVFPGGGVDPADCPPDAALDSQEAGCIAAVREAQEEAGVCLRAQDLHCISHWTAPKGAPRRYATWFYLTVSPTDVSVRVDGREIIEHCWLSPEKALEERAAGNMNFLPPTFVSLEWLCAFNDAHSAVEHYRNCEPQIFGPKILMDGDDICNIYAEDAAYDTDDVHAPGPRHRFRMGKGAWRYESNY